MDGFAIGESIIVQNSSKEEAPLESKGASWVIENWTEESSGR